MNYDYNGTSPSVHSEAAVCDEATVAGDVRIAAGASVWPGAVVRGDVTPVSIGEDTHVEDNAVVHGATLDDRVMVGHGTVLDVHVEVGTGTLVGSNATINQGVAIGDRSVVASGAVVPDGREIPAGSFVHGVPATVTPGDETSVDVEAILESYSPDTYSTLIEGHSELFESDI